MDSNSNNIVPAACAKVATPIVAQAPMMPIVVPIYVLHGEKLEKFKGLNFKM